MDSVGSPEGRGRGRWTTLEHECFLLGLKLHPQGPWKAIADYIGTRSVKQVQTHAQKYQQKVERRNRGLRKSKKSTDSLEHRVDEATTGYIESLTRVRANRDDRDQLSLTRQKSEDASTIGDADLTSLDDPIPLVLGRPLPECVLDDSEIEEVLETLLKRPPCS